MVQLSDGRTRVLFTGDLGRPHDAIMQPPAPLPETDYLVIESTYGNRRHEATDPTAEFGAVIRRTVERGGVVIVPSFAVGRAQGLLWAVHQLKAQGAIPHDLPVFLNSPMAVDVTAAYRRFRREHRLSEAQCDALCRAAHYVNTVEQSRALNERRGPMLIIAGSGMATGGRVVHHLKAFAGDARNSIVLAGFQAGGTRGAALLDGAETIKIHGQHVVVRAEVVSLSNLSAHADYGEILDWLRPCPVAPLTTFITHGEPAAADALRARIEESLRWRCEVPDYRDQVRLERRRA